MKVMVLGATGFIGPPLMRRLAALGHEPVGVARRPASDPAVLALDRGDPAAVAKAAEARRVGAVIDLLAMNLAATQPLLEALAGRVGRYVLASSGDVYRQYGAIGRKEPEPDPRPSLAEDAPLRTRRHPYRGETPRDPASPDAWMDDYDKIPIEQALAGRGDLASAVVRLPMVFGPGDRQRRFAWAIRPMLAQAPAIEVDAQWAQWRTSYGYVEDVAHGLALAAVHPGAAGVYNLGPAETPDHARWAERFAGVLRWTGELRRCDRAAAPEGLRARLDALDLSLPMALDSGRIRRELGYREITEATEALARTLEDESARPAT